MDQADDAFKQAYRLHVVEGETEKAIALCREALRLDPNHHVARVFLGCLLGDYGSDAEQLESREHFVEAIERAWSLPSVLADAWLEENPIYQLGIWEKKRGKSENALVFFIIDTVVTRNRFAERELESLYSGIDARMVAVVRLLVERIRREYEVVPVGNPSAHRP